MIPDSATAPVYTADDFDRRRAHGSAEVTWWRAFTDDGRDTAFGRRLAAELAAEQRKAVSS